jgi:hypothetical protein
MTSISTLSSDLDEDARSVFAQAHTLRRAGLHGEAITRLDQAMRSPLQHDEVFAGMALALKARSQVHLMDDAGATLTVCLIPTLVRRLNPKVDAHCLIVSGLVQRRRAYRSWKAGSPDVLALQSAIDCFGQARRAAENGIEYRLAFVAELNHLYTQGLKAAIAGRSQQENPELIVAAVQAEANARSKTPLEDAANIAGLTIIADMAIGGGLQPVDLQKLSDATRYREACQAVLPAARRSWPHELLCAASAANVPFEQKARALVLGSSCLTRHNQTAANQDLVYAYLVHLTDCDCTLPKATPGTTDQCSARKLVPGLAEQLTLLHRMFKHTFPGRRAFR